MQEQELEFAKRLSDDELIAKLTRCVQQDRDVTARLLVHLGEVDARGLFRDLGFSSMFDYAVHALHMSESEAWLRIRGARLGRAFPTALGMVARGELHMTALKLLAPVLTPSNLELLDKARFKSKLEIQTLIATHFPLPDVESAIRKLPTRKATSTGADARLAATATHPCSAATGSAAVHGPVVAVESPTQKSSEHAVPSATARVECGASPAARVEGTRAAISGGQSLSHAPAASSIVPLGEGRYKVQFTATQSLVDMFNEARDLFQNQMPKGDLPILVERALALLIAERKKQLFAQTSKPRVQRLSESDAAADKTRRTTDKAAAMTRAEPEPSKSNTRHIPHALRRQVYERDAGRCRFVSREGTQCRARGNLEFHHITPFARGGEATVDNICLMCRAHNALIAERDYGREFVKRRILDRGAAPSERLQASGLCREGAEQIDRTKAIPSGTPVSLPTIGLSPDSA